MLVLIITALSIVGVRSQKYVVSQEPANWFQALINCKNAGMELASVHSEEEKVQLDKYLNDNGHDKGYWLAGTKKGNGQYYWATTGTKIVYTMWLKGQPDDAKMQYNFNEGEDCIQWGMPTYSPKPVGWNDLGCFAELSYICQRAWHPKNPRSAFQAFVTQASVHSEEEKVQLDKYLNDNGHDKGYWLAGTKKGNGQYYWATTGTKIVYTMWLKGQPDDAKMQYNFNEGEDCIQWGMPTYSPKPVGWNDLGCFAELSYICQRFEYCYHPS